MNFLLDTHTFLWFLNGDTELSVTAKRVIENTQNEKFVSMASFWEIAIKLNSGKLEINMTFDELEWYTSQNGFAILPIRFQHIQRLLDMPLHHRDPFDRIIIAQAQCDRLNIVGKDPHFMSYDVTMKW